MFFCAPEKFSEASASASAYSDSSETFTEEQFNNVVEKYIVALSGVYDVGEAWDPDAYEQMARDIEKEVFADAYAGINAFGAGADRFTEAVNERMDQLYMGKIREQDNGAAEPTGPPKERFSSDEDHIKQQLRANQDVLNGMDPVAEIKIPDGYFELSKERKQDWVIKKLQPTGYKVDRRGFGVIEFAKKRLKSAFNYFARGSVEEATFEALPSVLKNGLEIQEHSDHKGRQYGTSTIAAPIVVNGRRGNMAAIVKKTTGNFYKVHRILTPDGSSFVLSEEGEAGPTPGGGVTNEGPLATPISPASNDRILDSGTKVKERFSYAGERAHTADLDSLERAKELRDSGVHDETIRQQTGWFMGMDGKWRWEIDDSEMSYHRRARSKCYTCKRSTRYRTRRDRYIRYGRVCNGRQRARVRRYHHR